MSVKIALAGNPNSGKTTLFNALTGSNQYVGNWPGVTVEKKEGKLKGHKDIIITDLPGIYSLSPYTLEEVVARNYLIKEYPDAIINIIDGTNAGWVRSEKSTIVVSIIFCQFLFSSSGCYILLVRMRNRKFWRIIVPTVVNRNYLLPRPLQMGDRKVVQRCLAAFRNDSGYCCRACWLKKNGKRRFRRRRKTILLLVIGLVVLVAVL